MARFEKMLQVQAERFSMELNAIKNGKAGSGAKSAGKNQK